MIKVALYGLMRVLCRVARRAAALARRHGGRARRRLRARRRRLRALPARAQASARDVVDRECRHHPARPRRRAGSPRARRARLGRDRVRRGAAAHAQPRRLQGAAVPRRGRVRARRPRARARSPRRSAAPHALDGLRVPGRRRCDRGSSPAERLRVRVADAAGAPAPAFTESVGAGGVGARSPWRPGAHGGARGVLLRQGRRTRPARSAAPPACATPSRCPGRCAWAWSCWRRWCVVLGAVPGALVGALRRDPARIAPASATASRLAPPRTGGLPTWRCGAVARRVRRRCGSRAVAASRATAPTWACGQRLEPALHWTSAGFTKPVRLVLEAAAAARTGDHDQHRGRDRAVGRAIAAGFRSLIEERVYAPLAAGALRGAAMCARLQSVASASTRSTSPGCSSALSRCARLGTARMSAP